jgi:tetratricopeptide (TPR) repeat protein
VVRGVANLLDPHSERPSRALGRLNFDRTALAGACAKPLLLLLPTRALRKLAHGAPNLWSWRSGMYRLSAGDDEVAEPVAGLPIDGAADRRARVETRRVLRHLVDELADGDDQLAVRALLRLASVETLLGDYDSARDGYERALTLAQALGERTLEADSVHGLADIARLQGDYDSAREGYERALTLAQALGDRTREATSVRGLAAIAGMQGDYDSAREGYQRALTLAQALGDRTREAAGSAGLGRVATAQGERDQARRRLRRAATIYRQLGMRVDERRVAALLKALDVPAAGG